MTSPLATDVRDVLARSGSGAGSVVLSLFPGIGLLDRAFEEAGFCIVRGPDVIWGGDVRTFHPPAGLFSGVIGGPPCQSFSQLAKLVRANGHEPRFGNLIPEFERCVVEAQPAWWMMENVPEAPAAEVPGYLCHAQLLNNRWLGEEQQRVRRICFGTRDGRKLHVETVALEAARYQPCVVGGGGFGVGTRIAMTRSGVPGTVTSSDGGGSKKMWRYPLPLACKMQGLPEDFLADSPFTAEGKLKAVANGVPLPMGRAIAAAVVGAMKPKPQNNAPVGAAAAPDEAAGSAFDRPKHPNQ